MLPPNPALAGDASFLPRSHFRTSCGPVKICCASPANATWSNDPILSVRSHTLDPDLISHTLIFLESNCAARVPSAESTPLKEALNTREGFSVFPFADPKSHTLDEALL